MNRREFVWTSGAAVTVALFGTPAFAEGKPIKIGYNVATLANPFFQGMTKGVVDASSKTPGVTLLNTNANGDANTQSTMVVDLINQGVDALILNPINANAIVPVVQQANKKGIPVFTLDRGASCGPCQVNFLETDNVALGREGAQYIIDKLKARYEAEGETALSLAAKRGETEVTRLLRERGAARATSASDGRLTSTSSGCSGLAAPGTRSCTRATADGSARRYTVLADRSAPSSRTAAS